MQPLLLITNRDAGTTDRESVEAALAVLRGGAEVEVAESDDPATLDDALTGAGYRRIVVAGGDGSLHAVIRQLHRRGELPGREVAVLPLGTGNDLARGTGIPLDVTEAARVALTGIPTPTDLLVDDAGGVVVNAVHVGAGAAAAQEGAGWKQRLGRVGVGRLRLGWLGYPIGALLTAWDPPMLRLQVEVDGRLVNDLDHRVLQVAVGVGPFVGAGTALLPEADPHDGLADVMVSRSVGRTARLLYGLRLGLATHHRRDDVVTVRGSQITVSGEPFRCSADGEISEPVRRRSWRVVPGAYSLVVPG